MAIHKEQSGFSAIEIIILLLVIASVGTMGWFFGVRSHMSTQQNATVKTAQKQPSNTAKTEKSTEGVSVASSKGYIDIKQLRVKFKLPDTVQDLQYVINTKGVAVLTSTSLMAAQHSTSTKGAADCNISSDTFLGPLGAIGVDAANPTSKPVYNRDQASCSDSENVSKLQLAQMDAIEAAFNATANRY